MSESSAAHPLAGSGCSSWPVALARTPFSGREVTTPPGGPPLYRLGRQNRMNFYFTEAMAITPSPEHDRLVMPRYAGRPLRDATGPARSF